MLQQPGAWRAPALKGMMPFVNQAKIARRAVHKTFATTLDLC
jgi:hypothetical protein